jgi:hypothetical protein
MMESTPIIVCGCGFPPASALQADSFLVSR